MRKFILAVLFVLSAAAHAGSRTAFIEGSIVTLTDEACANGVVLETIDMLSMLAPEVRGNYFAGSVKTGEQHIELCFKPVGKQQVFVVDELGGFGILETKQFKPGTHF